MPPFPRLRTLNINMFGVFLFHIVEVLSGKYHQKFFKKPTTGCCDEHIRIETEGYHPEVPE